ncbi:MAG: hypothetical protein ACFB4J_06890 [Elainellaceae cyanobacterium]
MIGKPGKARILVLGLWTAIAIGLRLYQLDLKPIWADEISTLAFSLGHGFREVPLRQMLTAAALLQPLQVDATATALDASRMLLAESNHPPLFFVLMHGWLQATHTDGDYVLIPLARSLSAIIGGLLTPIVYGLVWLALRAPAAARFSAALAALSPFGIYLSQEARHYSLALVWITASLCCLTEALRRLAQGKPLPYWLVALWIVGNGLGLATHYFMAIALLSQALVLAGFAGYLWRRGAPGLGRAVGQVVLVAIGTAASGLVWMFVLLAAPSQGTLTQWIQSAWRLIDWINPVTHTLASAISMAYLLPVQGVSGIFAGLGGLLAGAIALWSIWGLKQWRSAPPQSFALWGTCVTCIALFWGVSYGAQVGLAQVLRYHFVYFPAGIGVVAAGLAYRWQLPDRYSRLLVVAALLISLAGGLSVTHNLAYQKLHRPDVVAAAIAKTAAKSQRPVVIAASHQSHGQTGRLMAIAWEMRSRGPALLPQARFFLDPQPCAKTGEQNCGTPSPSFQRQLRQTLRQQGPMDVWLVNYVGRSPLQGCRYRDTDRVDGYKYQHYAC